MNFTLKNGVKIEMGLLKFLQIKEGKFIITNLFKVLFTLITLVFPMRI